MLHEFIRALVFAHSTLASKLNRRVLTNVKVRVEGHLIPHVGRILLPLQLLHGGNIRTLHVVLILLDLRLQVIQTDLVVLNHHVQLQLLDAIPDRNQLVPTPHQSVHLDRQYALGQLRHVGLVVPWLHVECHNTLRRRLRLALFLLAVVGETLFALCHDVRVLFFFLVGAEEIDVVIVVRGDGGVLGVDSHGDGFGTVGRDGFGGVAGERGEFVGPAGGVVVPAVGVGVFLDGGLCFEGLEAGRVGLGGGVA